MFIEKIKNLKNHLDSLEGVLIEEYAIRPGADEETLQQALQEAEARNLIIPEEFIEFYKTANGVTLIWQLQCVEEESLIEPGRINIVPIETFVEDGEGNLYFPDLGDTEDAKYFFEGYDMRRMCVFDEFVAEAGTLVYLPEEKPGEYEFVYHYYGEEIKSKGNLSLSEYLEWAIITKGFWYWIEGLGESFNTFEEFIGNFVPESDYVEEPEYFEACEELLMKILHKKI